MFQTGGLSFHIAHYRVFGGNSAQLASSTCEQNRTYISTFLEKESTPWVPWLYRLIQTAIYYNCHWPFEQLNNPWYNIWPLLIQPILKYPKICDLEAFVGPLNNINDAECIGWRTIYWGAPFRVTTTPNCSYLMTTLSVHTALLFGTWNL